jgi:tRNA modification GTPase
MDLSQTEAIADLIDSDSKAAHKVAINQMRGGFSKEISVLRQKLMDFASLIELELDFSEEDVEFADRKELMSLITELKFKINTLADSFNLGNAIKNGVPIAIVGAPNSGKSTLLNALLNEDKAIVSDIAGTTRDVIEDSISIEGITFRFFDTAGIRETENEIESQGIARAYSQIKKARIVLLLFDVASVDQEDVKNQIKEFREKSITEDQLLICVFNKMDQLDLEKDRFEIENAVYISAKNKEGIDDLKSLLTQEMNILNVGDSSIVTNIRHYEILKKCQLAMEKIEEGMNAQITGDLLAMDIREMLNLLGEITGTISSDELLGNIFGRFCIGK